jgi:hypothetical protein
LTDLRQVPRALEDELRPYAHFVAMQRVEEGAQPFTGAEIALAALGVAAWCAKQYVGAYLTELGRKHAADDEEPVAALALPESEAEAVLRELRALTDDAILRRASADELNQRWSVILDRLPGTAGVLERLAEG